MLYNRGDRVMLTKFVDEGRLDEASISPDLLARLIDAHSALSYICDHEE